MPVFMDNNNYIAWLYIRGIPEYIARARTILHLSTDACNMVLAWAIYSGIPLIAMQYNINVWICVQNTWKMAFRARSPF